MSGKLYVVGTPIGNLGDISPRALEVLESVDTVLCEDTRVTLKLLTHFNVKATLYSYHEHNAFEKGEVIIKRLLNGEDFAIVTDAGMPCISDPGEDIVRLCGENNIEVVVVPGPSAVISALAISGLSTSRFSFEGFLSVTKKSRFEHLNDVKNDRRTLVFYEAPHKLLNTLKDMLEVFGNRKISLVREITKLHEEVIRTTLLDALEYYRERAPKGEFVLVVEGAKEVEKESFSFEEALDLVKKLQDDGLSLSQAAKQAAEVTGFKKGDLYKGQIV